ncbi:MAG: PEGA domain-containing protein [Deltaproteobacteria bacterium]|nr:PEGA domain-containing protein [Deltaproteobacteria bacterium]
MMVDAGLMDDSQRTVKSDNGPVPGLRLLQVGTRAPSVDAFVEQFSTFLDDDSMLLPWAEGLVTGTVARLLMLLAGGQPVLRGRIQVLETIDDTRGRLIRGRMLELDDPSHDVHGRMLQLKRQREQMLAVESLAPRGLPPPTPGSAKAMPPPVPTMPAQEDRSVLFALIDTTRCEQDELTPSVTLASSTVTRGGAANRPGARLLVPPQTRNGHETPVTLDMASLTPEQLADVAQDRPVPHLTPPAFMPIRTGKHPRLTGKVMVARRSRLPAWAQQVVAPLETAWQSVLQKVPERQRPWAARGVPLLGVLVLFIWLGRCGGDSPDPAALAVVPGPDLPAPVVPEKRVSLEVIPSLEPLPPARCSVAIKTEPEGAEVHWSDKALGKTPLRDVEVPCGRSLVAIAHPHFEQKVLTVTAMVGRPLELNESLRHKEASVTLTSTPSGAVIRIGDQTIGRTPGLLQLSQFVPVEVSLDRDGYQPWAKTLSIEKNEVSVHATLKEVRGKKSAGRKTRRR